MDSSFTVAWLVIIGAGLLLELVALMRKAPGDTLSEHVWRVFRVRDKRAPRWTWALRAALLVGMGWLTGHFVFGIWGG